MKLQAFFSSKDKSKKLKCRLLQYLFGTLRIKVNGNTSTAAVKIKLSQRANSFIKVRWE